MSPLLYKVQTEIANQTGIFVVEDHNGTDVNTVRCRRESQIKDGRQKPEVEMKQRNITASILDSNESPKGYTQIFGVQQLSGTSVKTRRHRGEW